MSVRLSLALCLFAAAPAFAQPASRPAPVSDDMAAFSKELDALFVKGGLTPEQAAARAPRVSPEVHRRAAEVEAAIAQLDAARVAQVPIVGGSATYTRLSAVNIELMGIPAISVPQNSYAAQARLAVPLSDYVYRFPKFVDAAKLGVDAARTNQTSSEVNVAQDARVAYYEWVRAKLQVLVAERQHEQVKTVLEQVRALADAQRLSKADLMRVESEEADAERTKDQLRYLAVLREEQLRLLIGAKPEETLEVGAEARTDVTAPKEQGLDDLMKEATARRLEFRAIDLGIAAKEKQRESSKANYVPRLSAFATGDYANPNQRIFPLQQNWRFTWQAGVQLSWTLNDALLERTQQKRLHAETDQLRADRESLLRATRIQVLAAAQGVQTAVLSLATTQKGLAAAEESYRVRRELLNADRATAVELVDSETDLTRARIDAINARINLRIALAALAHALGEDTPAKR